MTPIGILGAGAFGTALALTFARSGTDVVLWARSVKRAKEMNSKRQNSRYLPGEAFPDGLFVTSDLERALESNTILLAIPMQQLGSILPEIANHVGAKILVACCKGIDLKTGLGPASLIGEICPSAEPAMLTGPSFAMDIAQGLPTALTLAVRDLEAGERIQRQLSTPTLRLYLTDDLVGAEIGGAMKNVVALAAGLTMGAGLGESARAAIITRGFAEMRRLSDCFGGRADTLMGLSGLGDLILTSTSTKSRNYSAGLAVGRGEDPPIQTTEGLATAQAVADIAKNRMIEMPLTQTLNDVLCKRLSLQQAISSLLTRPLKKE